MCPVFPSTVKHREKHIMTTEFIEGIPVPQCFIDLNDSPVLH